MPLREDLIRPDISVNDKRIIIRHQFYSIIQASKNLPEGMTKTPGQAQDLVGVMRLINRAIQHLESREETAAKSRVYFTEEGIDEIAENFQGSEIIVFSVIRSEPGSFSAGRPGEGNVKNQVPILREELDDPQNPGYKMAVLGYYYDNIIRLTCWARTNKAANRRVLWMQDLMQEYMWFFRSEGVARIFFQRRGEDFVLEHNGAKYYGRPLDYFVRTESLRQIREKTLEEIEVVTGLMGDGSTLRAELKS